MALKGILTYYKKNQENLEQDVKLTVYAYDSVAKLAMHFCYEGNDYMRELDMWRFFDTVYDKALKTFEYSTELHGDPWRRMDISQGDKFATNFQNRKATTIIAAAYRYAMTHSKRKGADSLELGDKKFSTTFEYESFDADGNKISEFTRENGVLVKLYIDTPLLKLELDEDIDKDNAVIDVDGQYVRPDGNKMFAKFQVKDKYQNVLSKTPIKNISFKYSSEILGFAYTVVEKVDSGTIIGMYQNMDEVIDAHPDKNFAWIRQRKYRIVTDDDLQEVLQGYYDYDGIIAIDTETSGLSINFKSRTGEGDQLVGICLSKEEGTGDFIPLKMKHFANVCDGNDWFFMTRYMKKFLETHKFVTHNLSFDWKVFYIYGINLNAVFDTMLAYNSTERYKHINFATGLKELTKNIFDCDMIELSDFVYGVDWENSGVKFWDLTYEQCRQYAPTDADSTLRLYNHVIGTRLVESFGAEKILEIELTFAKVIGYSEFWGYHLAIDELPTLVSDIENGMQKSKAELIRIAGQEFNPDSPKQLGHIMYDVLQMPVLHNDKGTSKTILKELSEIENLPHSDFIQYLLDYRRDAGVFKNFIKRKNDFISEDGYIFPHVFSFGTDTGRCSIKEPNYQSYNDVVKKRVVPRGGFKMFDCDFSQIEYRVLCSIANEENLKQAFLDPDMDYHTYQAARMFDVPYGAVTSNLRKQAKGINFGLPYGMGDRSLGLRIFGQASKENTIKAGKLRLKYFDGQENIERWFDITRDNAVANGYSRTLFGRSRFYFREIFSESKIRRQAGNHVIQGCLDGDTRIQTREFGIVKIKDVVGTCLDVWDGKQWTKGDITYSGKKQKCVVHFKGGLSIICSPIHKFLVRSHRGTERFVECKDLLGLDKTKNAHRVVINQEYKSSDYKYTSKFAYKYRSFTHNANNVFMENIGDSFKIGVVLGRLASDGSYMLRTDGGSCLTQFVSEHEKCIIPILKSYMKNLGVTEANRGIREGRNEQMFNLNVYSASLASEVDELDIKHQVHDNIFMDTEVLRGFLSGFFDGDGGISGKTIALTFGVQYDFEPMCKDLQKALLFFGIRSHYRKYADRYVIQIKTNDNQRFLDIIGFVNEAKQTKGKELKCVEDEHIFGRCLRVESVEITDEYIDMYDVCNTERGYYVANGVITHNTAADIYKIACNRLFEAIVAKGWLDKVLINAFIHDEILGEVSDEINPFEFIEVWRAAFEVPVENFCKLYAGFGFGRSWYEAKKQDLTPPFIEEIIKSPLRDTWNKSSDEFIDWIYTSRYDYELRRVIDYLKDEKSQGEIIKPIIEAYMREKLNDCPEEIVSRALEVEDLTPYKKMKGDKFKEWDVNLKDAIKIFCLWMNETREQGILDAGKINILSASDVELSKPKVEHVFDINNTNMSDKAFIKEYINNMGYYVDYENKAAYIKLSVLQLTNRVDDFISRFCVQLTDDEVENNELPNVILVDGDNVYPSKFYLNSAMFMVLQMYMGNLVKSITG